MFYENSLFPILLKILSAARVFFMLVKISDEIFEINDFISLFPYN